MKRKKLWDSTTVFLVGLQAMAAEPRPDEIPTMNLMSDSTRVSLLVKPARKARDGEGGTSWKIDANVSLADIGTTIFDLVGVAPVDGQSLEGALAGPQPDLREDRLIVTESAWDQWRRAGTIRAAVRKGPFLYLFDERDQLFNTVTDSLEANPLRKSDPSFTSLGTKLSDYLRSLGFSRWRGAPVVELERALLAKELWRDRPPSAEHRQRLKDLARRFPGDERIRGWRAKIAVQASDWKELKAAAGRKGERPDWEFVAARNLGEKVTVTPGPCFEFVRNPGVIAKACPNEAIADLLIWANEGARETARARAADQFTRYYLYRALAERVAESNLLAGEHWDSVAFDDNPDAVDLILALPEFRKIKATLANAVTRD
jgi:hypothetical protein